MEEEKQMSHEQLGLLKQFFDSVNVILAQVGLKMVIVRKDNHVEVHKILGVQFGA